jgi:hypothetical protein
MVALRDEVLPLQHATLFSTFALAKILAHFTFRVLWCGSCTEVTRSTNCAFGRPRIGHPALNIVYKAAGPEL